MTDQYSTGERPTPLADTVLANLAQRMEDLRVPGLALAVAGAGGTTVTSSGLAGAEPPTRLAESTVFPMASMTNPVFAYAVARLAEEVSFDLDAPLGAIVDPGPGLMRDPRAVGVTAPSPRRGPTRHRVMMTTGVGAADGRNARRILSLTVSRRVATVL